MTGRERVDTAVGIVILIVGAVTAVTAVLQARWWAAAGGVALLATGIGLLRAARTAPARRRASTAAVAEWPPERVHAVTAGIDDEVQAVRAVRRADPALGLVDAVAVVRDARRGRGH